MLPPRMPGWTSLLAAAALSGLISTEVSAEVSGEGEPRRPNIIYIMLDDAGYGDFGAFGSPHLETPTFDRMCREGTTYRQHYSGSAVCAPTRCVLMTGLHPGHCRRRDNTATAHHEDFEGRPLVFLEPEDVTLAESLQAAGYTTAGIGKWALGNPGSTGEPERQGFDHWFGYLDQVHAHDHYTDWLWRDGRRWDIPQNAGDAREVYIHDLFEQQTLEFLKRQGDRPFFLYLAYTLPHGQYVIPADDPAARLYRDRPWSDQVKQYAAMVTRADRTVGLVLAQLEELGIDDQTLVFYTSDNGPNRPFVEPLGSNGPFRGTKRQLYEGGLRAAMAVRWPTVVPAGRESDYIWSMVDVFPTCCELAGAPTPPNLDGISIASELRGEEAPPRPPLYWEIHHPFQQAVRTGPFKAIRFGTREPVELYHLPTDPGESQNVAGDHPQIVAEVTHLMDTSRTESRYWPAVERRRRGRR